MLKKIVLTFLVVSSLAFSDEVNSNNLWKDIKTDFTNYYLNSNYKEAGAIFLIGGIMANTNIDQNLRDYYQDEIRNTGTDNQSTIYKLFGEGQIMIPLALTTGLIGSVTNNETIQTWGEQVSRSYFVGFPTLLLMQRVTGGSRPEEKDYDKPSNWNFFNDDNGVSGHSFMGSIPFLVAANMCNNANGKKFFYLASALTGFSRINDDAHFTSQSILGWYMGYMAVKSVNKTENSINPNSKLTVMPVIGNETYGISFIYK